MAGTSVVLYLAPSLLLPLAQAQLAWPDVTAYVPVPPCDVTVLLVIDARASLT